jgi:hypothetical protein
MKKIAATLIFSMLTGCAVSPAQFYANKSGFSDSQLCRATQTTSNVNFKWDVVMELDRRGVTSENCEQMIRNQNIAIGAALIGVAAIAASRGGSGGGASSSTDYEWDWDQFYNEYRKLVWACRGVQTGQFADGYHCSGKYQIDSRWPQK